MRININLVLSQFINICLNFLKCFKLKTILRESNKIENK